MQRLNYRDPLLWSTIIVTVGLSLAVALHATPLLVGPSPQEWQWSFSRPWDVRPLMLLLPIGLGAALTAACLLWRDLNGWQLALIAALTVAFWFGVHITSSDGLSVHSRLLNPTYFSVFMDAIEVDNAAAFLDTYAESHDQLSYRQKTHPPGNTLFFWLIDQSIERLPWLTAAADPIIAGRGGPPWLAGYTTQDVVSALASGLTIPVMAALSVFPLYDAARRLSSDRVARLSLALFALAPVMALFIPVIDLTFALVAAGAFWLVIVGLEQESPLLIAASGFVASLGTVMSYSMLPLCLFLALVVAFKGWPDGLQSVIKRLAWLAAGGVSIWVVLWLVFGFDPIRTFFQSITYHEGGYVRRYWIWLLYNPWDLLLFFGIPTMVIWITGMVRDKIGPIVGAFLLTLALLWLSGMLRGETARALLYLMPLVAWMAADHLDRLAIPPAVVCGLLIAQTLLFEMALSVYH